MINYRDQKCNISTCKKLIITNFKIDSDIIEIYSRVLGFSAQNCRVLVQQVASKKM